MRAACHLIEEGPQGGDAVGAAGKRDLGESLGAAVDHRAGLGGQAVKLPIVENDRVTIGRTQFRYSIRD